MTRDEVIELAKQAGFADGVVEIVGLYGFMKFASLVAAAEREECAKLVDFILKEGGGTWGDVIRNRNKT